MNYEIGDTVVHWTHGLGRVIGIDEMLVEGITQQYYVVEVDRLKLWVPVDDENDSAIRFPAKGVQFDALFDVLREPGEKLPDHQYQRKLELRDRMQKSSLEDICRVIRDLTDRSRKHTLNQNDSAVLYRAEEHLLDEWVLSLGVERSSALSELEGLLGRDHADAQKL